MSVDRAVLDQQLEGVPEAARWLKRPEVNLLATLIAADERVLTGVTGWVIERGKLAVRTWLVFATSQRLLCLLKGRAVEIPLAAMKAAYTDARLGYHEVIIESADDKLVVSGMPKDAAVRLATALSGALARQPSPGAARAANEFDLDVDGDSLPMLSDTFDGAPVTHAEMEEYVQQMKRVMAEIENTRRRLSAVEDIIRKAAARSAAAKVPAS